MIKQCDKHKKRYYIKLIIYNLIIIFSFQIIYFCEITNYIDDMYLQKVLTIVHFTFCYIFCVLITMCVQKEMSDIDILTGTYTREKLYLDLTKLIKNKQKIIVMYIDLNDFKRINDSYGHLAGDEILKSFGKKTSSLGNDIRCYRMGGDEFIVVAGAEESTQEKINYFVNSDEFDFAYGISKFPDKSIKFKDVNSIIEELISIADSKMYENKLEKK